MDQASDSDKGKSSVGIEEIVATVDNEPIRYGELLLLMNRKRSEAIRYFYDRYQAEDHGDYWTTDYGGEKPIEWLKAAALEDVIQIKVQHMMAKDEGIIEHIDYIDFRNDWLAENKRREQAHKTKELIYGPRQYEEIVYYEYVLSNIVLKMKDKQRQQHGLTVEEGERKYEEMLRQKLNSVSRTINQEVYDRIQTLS